MKSNISERTFWSNDGWFMSLRRGDENILSFAGNRPVRIRTCANGVIAGPFNSLEQVEVWFETFLARHASPREIQVNNKEIALDFTAAGRPLELIEIEETRMLEKSQVRFQFA